MQESFWWWQCNDRCIIYLPPPPPPYPLPPFSASLISLMVSVDVKHRVYLLYNAFFFKYPPKWCTYGAVLLLHGCCHVKLLQSRRMFCVHHATMHQFTVSLYSKPHTQGTCVFNCNLPPALLAEWPRSFTCCCGKTGVEQIPKWESAQKVDHWEENYPAALAGNRTRDL